MAEWSVVNADCRAHLRTLPDNSIDAAVTDPPYEIGFIISRGLPPPNKLGGLRPREIMRRGRRTPVLACGHRPGECGECLRCGRCYLGFAKDHACPDGRAGGHAQMPSDAEPSPLWTPFGVVRRP